MREWSKITTTERQKRKWRKVATTEGGKKRSEVVQGTKEEEWLSTVTIQPT
jgi:hypothetical protein